MKAFLKYQGKTSPKLRKAVISGLGEIESLLDVANHGAQGGYGNFCYHSDTVAFYKKYKKDIMMIAAEDAGELGLTVSDMVSNFNCLKNIAFRVEGVLLGYHSDELDKTQVFNALAWYALESVAYDYQSFKEEC